MNVRDKSNRDKIVMHCAFFLFDFGSCWLPDFNCDFGFDSSFWQTNADH